jgi:hypothetical protein
MWTASLAVFHQRSFSGASQPICLPITRLLTYLLSIFDEHTDLLRTDPRPHLCGRLEPARAAPRSQSRCHSRYQPRGVSPLASARGCPGFAIQPGESRPGRRAHTLGRDPRAASHGKARHRLNSEEQEGCPSCDCRPAPAGREVLNDASGVVDETMAAYKALREIPASRAIPSSSSSEYVSSSLLSRRCC